MKAFLFIPTLKPPKTLSKSFEYRPHSSFGNSYTNARTCTDSEYKRDNSTGFCCRLVLFALQTRLEVVSWEQ